jgi:hypothetical protein
MQKTPKSNLSSEKSATLKSSNKTITTSESISDEVMSTSGTALNAPESSPDEQVARPKNIPNIPDKPRFAVDLIIANMLPINELSHQETADQTLMNELADQIITNLISMKGFSDITINRVDQITDGQSAEVKIDLTIRESSSDERVGRPDNRPGRPDNRASDPDERVGRPDNRPGRPDNRASDPDERVGRPDNRPGRPDNRASDPDERVGRPDNRPGRPDNRASDPDERVGRTDNRPGRPDNR